MTIGIKRLHQIAVLLTILIGPAEALSQPPAPESPIGAADLFKKSEGPSSDDSPPFARRSTEVIEQICRYLHIGTTFLGEQRYAEAESLYAAAIALAESDDGSPYYLFHALFYQANVMARQSRLDESRALIDRAGRCDPGSSGIDPDQLDFMFNFSEQVYKLSKKMSDLEPILRKLCSLEARSLGEGHPQVARHVHDLGNYLNRQGKPAEAEEVFSGRVTSVEKHLGLEAPELDEAVDRLVRFYREEAREAEAERLIRGILARREGQLGPNHEKVAETFLAYSKWLRQSGRDVEADSCVARAVGIRWRNGLVGLTATRKAASSLAWLNRPGL